MQIHLPATSLLITTVLITTLSLGAEKSSPPLYDDLGDLHYPVTANEQAQAYFDQGLRLYYAFNHSEAIASFREAQRLDPSCAMCWWGEAISWGPNINLPMAATSTLPAFTAMQQAQNLATNAGEKEQRLINALSQRYLANPGDNRSELDLAYFNAMKELAQQYPQDDDIVVLFGESVMDLSPWNYWTEDNQLRPEMANAVQGFSSVLERSPRHPGACHFFIHAVEKVQPERALPCAEQLAALMPGAGHIVHMPGHIYIRVGRYMDAIAANEHAVHADETFIADRNPDPGMYTLGYYPHNYDFLAFAALMAGRADLAIESADKLASLIPEEELHNPATIFQQHHFMRPALVRIRFERWQDILEIPEPEQALAHAHAIWTYAQGRAMLANGNIEGASEALSTVHEYATGTELEGARLEFNESQQILSIAEAVLAGLIADAEGNLQRALDFMRIGVSREDALLYGEPPEWTVPVREELGQLMLNADLASAAEQAFKEDLQHFPENVWSLAGLTKALSQQGKTSEARVIKEKFDKAWEGGSGKSPLAGG